MDYRVLIFMAKDRLAAIDVDEDDVPDPVSLNGKDVMAYTSEAQIKVFCEYVKEYYNIDQFSDLGMEISILRFDAAMKDTFVLLNLLQEGGVGVCNLVSVEKLLPWIAVKEGLLKAGTVVQMKTFDLVYTVALDKDMILQCYLGNIAEGHMFDFPKEKFAEYYHLGKKNLFGCEDEKREWQKKLDEEIEKREKQIEELDKQLLTALLKIKTLGDNLAESQRALDERQGNAGRRVCYLKCATREKDIMYTAPMFGEEHYWSFRHLFGTGVVVSKGTKIAEVIVRKKLTEDEARLKGMWGTTALLMGLSGALSSEEFTIKAETAGRLFWLSEEVPEKIAYGDAIAVIGNESDIKADVMKWYEEINRGGID